MTRSGGIGIGEEILMPVFIGDRGLGLREALITGIGSEDWVCGSG